MSDFNIFLGLCSGGELYVYNDTISQGSVLKLRIVLHRFMDFCVEEHTVYLVALFSGCLGPKSSVVIANTVMRTWQEQAAQDDRGGV